MTDSETWIRATTSGDLADGEALAVPAPDGRTIALFFTDDAGAGRAAIVEAIASIRVNDVGPLVRKHLAAGHPNSTSSLSGH